MWDAMDVDLASNVAESSPDLLSVDGPQPGDFMEVISTAPANPDHPSILSLPASELIQVIHPGPANAETKQHMEAGLVFARRYVKKEKGKHVYEQGWVDSANLVKSTMNVSDFQNGTYRAINKNINWKNGVLLTLFLLRTGIDVIDAHPLFGVSHSTALRMFVVYLQALRFFFLTEFPYPTEEQIWDSTPDSFKKQYPGRKIQEIIDCHEQRMEDPSDFMAKRSCWSQYKHYYSAKFFAGIFPCGAFGTVAGPWGGGCDDKTATQCSGYYDRLYAFFTSLADKGFLLHGEFIEKQHELMIPPKKFKGRVSFNTDEMRKTDQVGSKRIHVERAFSTLTNWKIYSKRIKISNVDLWSSIYFVTCMMCNYEPPQLLEEGTPNVCLAEMVWGRT